LRALVARDLEDQVGMIQRRLEVMAAEVMRTGKVTVTGDLYPTVVVDFGRDSGLTITLSGSQRWGQSGVKPLDSLQDWSLLVTQKCGAMPIDVLMDVDAWKVFRADPDVKARLDRFRGNSTMVVDAKLGEGGTFMGSIDGFNFWVYASWYVDPVDGQEKPILPSGTVLLSGPQLEGVRAFGAIRDEQAGFQAMPYFPKSWLENDPAVRYLMTQSAPLVVPYRVNGCLAANVL
jgi:hypothetical protein